ncbi:MAG: hypothetical protein HZB16_16700 [Armatimonadetes bacterium]|nr:hypothetical protein [Armatimonadota bacterium]
MIRVKPAPEPPSFDERVRQPGLAQLPELKPHWRRCLPDLLAAYQHICAYSCFYIHPVAGARTVEHFGPKSASPELAYEWSNYRLVCSLMNSRKQAFDDVLDPFEIENGWFVLDFVNFEVHPDVELAIDHAAIQATIDRLGLNDAPCPSTRQQEYEMYERGDASWRHLCRVSPFVAAEVERQGLRRAGD